MGKKDTSGNITGTLGNVIFYKVGNQIRVRTKPSKINTPQTESVKKSKSRFKQANSLAKKLYRSSVFFGSERNSETDEMVYNSIMRIIMKSGLATMEQKETNWIWENVQFSEGSLIVPTVNWELSEDKIKLQWDKKKIESSSSKEIIFVQIDCETEQVMSLRLPAFIEQAELPLGVIRPINNRKTALYVLMIHQSSTKILKSNTLFLGFVNEKM